MSAAEVTYKEVAPDDPRALALHRDYMRSVAKILGLPPPTPMTVSAGLEPPHGAILLAAMDGVPSAIGGVRDLAGPVAEIKSMYVAPAARGRGIGRQMLERLEEIAAARGCEAVRLDTLAALRAAIALYESAGYEQVADYNGSPHADLWFERRLV